MAEELTTVQIDVETREVLRGLAGEDYRSMASELKWLVTQEHARRYSQPNPVITVEEARASGDCFQAPETLIDQADRRQ